LVPEYLLFLAFPSASIESIRMRAVGPCHFECCKPQAHVLNFFPLFFMPEFTLGLRVEHAHEEPIWAVTHVKDNIFATGSLDESVKLW
jgi:hypothetical protein